MEKYFKMKINAHNKTPKVDQSIDIGKKIKAFLIDVISHLFFFSKYVLHAPCPAIACSK